MPDEPFEYLIRGYFHEDFDLYGEDWDEVVDFFAGENQHRLVITLESIDRVLANSRSDEDVRAVLRASGCAYRIEPGTAREFLQGIRDRLASHRSA